MRDGETYLCVVGFGEGYTRLYTLASRTALFVSDREGGYDPQPLLPPGRERISGSEDWRGLDGAFRARRSSLKNLVLRVLDEKAVGERWRVEGFIQSSKSKARGKGAMGWGGGGRGGGGGVGGGV